jgi:hypothetical protein
MWLVGKSGDVWVGRWSVSPRQFRNCDRSSSCATVKQTSNSSLFRLSFSRFVSLIHRVEHTSKRFKVHIQSSGGQRGKEHQSKTEGISRKVALSFRSNNSHAAKEGKEGKEGKEEGRRSTWSDAHHHSTNHTRSN